MHNTEYIVRIQRAVPAGQIIVSFALLNIHAECRCIICMRSNVSINNSTTSKFIHRVYCIQIRECKSVHEMNNNHKMQSTQISSTKWKYEGVKLQTFQNLFHHPSLLYISVPLFLSFALSIFRHSSAVNIFIVSFIFSVSASKPTIKTFSAYHFVHCVFVSVCVCVVQWWPVLFFIYLTNQFYIIIYAFNK